MPWDPKFSVGLEEIDAQHRHFIQLLDWIELATKSRNEERLPLLVRELVRYANYHFSSEESLMDSYEIAGAAHRLEHARILARAEELLAAPDFRPAELRLFMYKWFVVHTQLADLELATQINDRRRELEQSCGG